MRASNARRRLYTEISSTIVLQLYTRYWNDSVDLRPVVLRIAGFFRDESCGQCTPCRSGTAKAYALMQSPKWDLQLLSELSQVMRDASICGLGQAAPNPFDTVIKYFPHELG